MTTLLILLALQVGDKGFATTKEAMQKVQLVIGEWTGSGVPEDSKEASWAEKISWNFKIDKDAYAITLAVSESKFLKSGTLTYDLKKKAYRFELTRSGGELLAYEGKLIDTQLTLTQVPEKDDADQERLEFNLLRENRYFINVERRKAGSKSWNQVYNLGYKKEGVPFVRGESAKCVVTGGSGTISVSHKGQTYYVC